MCKKSLLILLVLCLSCTNTKTNESNDNKVYVCSGPQSHCYHFDSLCVAFIRCTGERIEIPLDTAVRIYEPCGFCVKRNKDLVCEKSDTIIEDRNKEIKTLKKRKNKKDKHFKPKYPPRNILADTVPI